MEVQVERAFRSYYIFTFVVKKQHESWKSLHEIVFSL